MYKKMIVIGACALTSMALVVPSAMATPRPRADTNASHWTGVQVNSVGDCTPTNSVPCTFDAHSTASVFNGAASCDVVLTVDLYANGKTSITGAAITPSSGTFPDTLCGAPILSGGIRARNLPWKDQICEWNNGTDPHEYWDGIDVSLWALGNPLSGDIYGQVQDSGDSSTSPFDHIDVDDLLGGPGGPRIQADHGTDPYVFDQEIDAESVENAPCIKTNTDIAWQQLS
jgi:hypothetical protein